jgi:hypothetical protein
MILTQPKNKIITESTENYSENRSTLNNGELSYS